MQSLDIQSFSYEERHGLLPTLTSAFADCGGWILDRKTLSPTTMEFRIEIQLRAVVDLYASILASGLELTRAAISPSPTSAPAARTSLLPPTSARSSPSASKSASSKTHPPLHLPIPACQTPGMKLPPQQLPPSSCATAIRIPDHQHPRLPSPMCQHQPQPRRIRRHLKHWLTHHRIPARHPRRQAHPIHSRRLLPTRPCASTR